MYLLGILALVVGLVVSVALHEVGHMWPAKKFGVKVPEFYVGFGPKLWARQRGETEYGVRAVLLGGFVKLAGMYPPARKPDKPRKDGKESDIAWARRDAMKSLAPGEEHRAFYRLTVPRKIAVMLGGPLMNLAIAVVLMVVALSGIGVPRYDSGRIATVAECIDPAGAATQPGQGQGAEVSCPTGLVPGPAYAAGLRPGDEIVSWNGTRIAKWDEVLGAVAASPAGQPATVVVRRLGQEQTLQVTPLKVVVATGDGQTERSFVGLTPQAGLSRLSLPQSFATTWLTFKGTLGVVADLPSKLSNAVFASFGSEKRDPNGVVGLVGVGRVAGEISSADIGGAPAGARVSSMLLLLANLNLSLFIFNLLPLLPLDGGHIAGALWEGLRKTYHRLTGRSHAGPADTAKLLPLTMVVGGVLIAMMLILIVADFLAPV
ncbi:PDZ domain-containing protein [Buchananella hordeovulneris]|uniref:PDZ domain-containing protein n=1 Tax=Buchananella hordeovulneris TaxID=52770 RepID=A0A1Q5PXI6_9ACTO|nr:site-2 protease family protein [Buchananella hordeovulneris]OKL52162.1 hypothetical protein BSZ40_04485 [Buchananella hordeovulneris]RRD52483.1 PDZ domain-containing protein [Buchananella hordeovulneris]